MAEGYNKWQKFEYAVGSTLLNMVIAGVLIALGAWAVGFPLMAIAAMPFVISHTLFTWYTMHAGAQAVAAILASIGIVYAGYKTTEAIVHSHQHEEGIVRAT
jgi:hypothetical protein